MSLSLEHFEALYHANFNPMCNLSNRIIKDKDAAKDIVQEIFIKLWNRPQDWQAVDNMRAYLFRATSNASINYLGRSKRTVSITTLKIVHAVAPEDTMTKKNLEARIQVALDQLPPKCRAVFALSRFEGMKYREIAEHLGISIKTVENQMGIALAKMREALAPYLTRDFLAITVIAGAIFLFRFLLVSK